MNEPFQAASSRGRRIGLPAVFAMMVALLAGCVSPNAATQVKNFSSAVTLTSSNSAQAYQLVEKAYFDKQFSQAVLDCGEGTNIHVDSFDPRAFKFFWQSNDLQVRRDILNGLTTYATQLSTLMGNPALSNLDQDTTKLAAALTNLDQQLASATFIHSNTITAEEIKIFTAGVNFIGHWVITRKEQKEAKRSIQQMQQYVPQICQVLKTDLGYLRQQMNTDFEVMLESEDAFFRHNARSLDPIQRRTELGHLVDLAKEMQTADAAMAGTQNSMTALAAAHQALGQAFEKDTTKLNSLISEVSTEAQRVAAYYNSLQTNK